MIIWAVLGLALAAATVEMDMAPDQPLPFVYVDDPLIIEFRAPEDAEATAGITLQRTSRSAFS